MKAKKKVTKRKRKVKKMRLPIGGDPPKCEACGYVGKRLGIPSNKHGWESQCARCLALYRHP
jgi:predicted Zn-ribbon and HTH transcriptional regulator